MRKLFFLIILSVWASSLKAEPRRISLQDYSFDFASIGYEIKTFGQLGHSFEPLEAGDFTWLKDKGYRIRVRISPLSRAGKKELTELFNSKCIGFDTNCRASVSGEVQLNDDMQVVLFARSININGKVFK